MSITKKILRINWWATIALSYHVGGLAAVLRMPVKVYGALKWDISGGALLLPADAPRNSLIIGSPHEDYTASSGKAQLAVHGTWKVGTGVKIGADSFIGVRKGGMLTMGSDIMLGRDTQIHCTSAVTIGSGTFGGETYITDSTEHTIIRHGEPCQRCADVIVGEGSYLGFRTMLLKGCHIPPHSVVASGAVCTKDYTLDAAEHVLLAGVPAVIKETDVYSEI